jgi:hypothetical protein
MRKKVFLMRRELFLMRKKVFLMRRELFLIRKKVFLIRRELFLEVDRPSTVEFMRFAMIVNTNEIVK